MAARRQSTLTGEELAAYKGMRRERSVSYALGACAARPLEVDGSTKRLEAIAEAKQAARAEVEAYQKANTPPAWLVWLLYWAGRAAQARR